jgi:RNA polymerase sigma-70 factor, ECF subfamily
VTEGVSVKQAPALSWPDVADREAALIHRCVEGDAEACATLVSEHQRMVFLLALNLLGDYEDARDLSQDVFLQVFRTLERFRAQSSLRTWIYRIAVNQARNRHRWWRRRRRGDQVSIEEHIQQHGELPETTGAAEPDRQLSRKETADRVWQALDALPFDQRTAMVLREIDGLSYDEIAFSLGVAIGTVKSRLTRAREALRVQLREARDV